MLGINGWEFIALAVLGILILGPDRMPEYAQKLAQLIFRGRAAGLRYRIVGACERIGEIERDETIAGIAVRCEAP